MIAVVHVTLTQGELVAEDALRTVASNMYSNRAVPEQQERATGLKSYVELLEQAAVYTCTPRAGAFALFLWLATREFEVVIETFPNGHLMRAAESVVTALRRRLNQLDMKADIQVSLQSPSDAQTYMVGASGSIGLFLLDSIKENLVGLGIGILLIIIASTWLTQYFQEAVAGVISLTLFTLWQLYSAWAKLRLRCVNWRIYG